MTSALPLRPGLDGAASMQRVCVTRHTWMSIAPKTSTALRACSACVSPDTSGRRGRADVNRAQDLARSRPRRRCEHAAHVCVTRHTRGAASMQRMCVSQDTPGLRGRADVNRAQDLDGAASMQRMCVSQDTPGLRGRADQSRSGPRRRCEHARVCQKTHPV